MGEEYEPYHLTDDLTVIPDENINYYDANAVSQPKPSAIRPSDSGNGVELEIPDTNQMPPSVTINLDQPGLPGTSVKIYELRVPGNVASVRVYFKENDDQANEPSTILQVDKDGLVELPTRWRKEVDKSVTVGILKISPRSLRSPTDQVYIFKVDIISCYNGMVIFHYYFKLKTTRFLDIGVQLKGFVTTSKLLRYDYYVTLC